MIEAREDQPFDGLHILSTKDCLMCPFHAIIEKENLCGVKEYYRYLIKIKKPKKCHDKDMKVENPSINYLRDIRENPEKYKISELETEI